MIRGFLEDSSPTATIVADAPRPRVGRWRSQRRLGRISFKGTLDAVRHFADAFHAARGKPRRQRQLCEQLLCILAKDTLPWRPDRHEPHARKRRPKQYQLPINPAA